MEKNRFKLGDIVKLNSGGPEMTIIEIFDRIVKCSWYSESKFEYGDFPFDCLLTIYEVNKLRFVENPPIHKSDIEYEFVIKILKDYLKNNEILKFELLYDKRQSDKFITEFLVYDTESKCENYITRFAQYKAKENGKY